ncbi:alkaline phosphatase family protein [Alishewanella tabrizica]|uniref:Alkaline phosphatase family protein n=1 Tax=Alishewanella tabrizica TaxID=671278 RepID=A0ABQ2WK21_9ALTE|nr:ectonucleotide pyrophosphatase/phosphodiesterase [Alishewanella tabrizica]GGW59173.1 alkaline phosphatase family protein [Alishewanella tabrizica]
MKVLVIFLSIWLVACSGVSKPQPNASVTRAEQSLIIISIDGLRHDYLTLHHAPMLAELAAAGVHVEALEPVFPSKTFPNHYSLVTGLHPEKHGIVDNSMYDPLTKRQFSMRMSDQVADGFWWQGEPIWVTAELQGVKAATYFFPGSEAEIKGTRPSYWFPYVHETPNRQRTEQVLAWLAMPLAERPRVITLYFSDVDSAGHNFGPKSTQVREALAAVDAEVRFLFETLRARDQLSQVNILVSSDHGMAEVDQRKYIIADELFDASLAQNVRFSREIISIFPKTGEEARVYEQIAQRMNAEQMRLYRKTDLPARFHHQQHERIAPIMLLAEQPWIFVRKSLLPNLKADPSFLQARGSHGYDNTEQDMQGMLIAYGPAFQQQTRVARLSMVDIYNVMAAVIGVTAAQNDGDKAALPLMLAQD